MLLSSTKAVVRNALARSSTFASTSSVQRNPIVLRAAQTGTMAADAVSKVSEPDVSEDPIMCFSWTCPYVHRVTLALAHKGASIRKVEIDLSNKPAWLGKYSPLLKVPAVTYLEGGQQQVLYESLALINWVDDYYEGPALLPLSPAQRCKARIIISRIDSGVMGTFYQLLSCQDKDAWPALWTKLHTELSWLEDNISATGPFLMGEKPSLVDAAIAPWLLRKGVLQHWRKVDMVASHPKLAAYLEAYKALPEVQSSFISPGGNNFAAWEQGAIDVYVKFAKEVIDMTDVSK